MDKEDNRSDHYGQNDHGLSANKIKRESESLDDFEHVEHVTTLSSDGTVPRGDSIAMSDQLLDLPRAPANLVDIAAKLERNLLDTTIYDSSNEKILQPVPATPPPSADLEKFGDSISSNAQSLDPFSGLPDLVSLANKKSVADATMAFIEVEKMGTMKNLSPKFDKESSDFNFGDDDDDDLEKKPKLNESHGELEYKTPKLPESHDKMNDDDFESGNDFYHKAVDSTFENKDKSQEKSEVFHDDFSTEVKSTVLPAPESAPIVDFLREEASYAQEYIADKEPTSKSFVDDTWNLMDNFAPTKPLPPLPTEPECEQPDDKRETFHQFPPKEIHSMVAQRDKPQELKSDSSSTRIQPKPTPPQPKFTHHVAEDKIEEVISAGKIFSDMGLDAWFNPERLNPRVAALIYWRHPEETGFVFGATLAILLSLVHFSLISVFSYGALLALMGTMGIRIYKTIMQAVQKTSDGHPFKEILDIDLTLPAEKVHEVADVAVAHINAAVTELRRRFLIEDFVDSLKFGVVLWCLTYVGSWFNGMTLIIIGVIALFTLPKVYETNKAQIDQNLALVHSKINELTVKVKAAIPMGKKAEPTKEE